jgi:hypothetical protein
MTRTCYTIHIRELLDAHWANRVVRRPADQAALLGVLKRIAQMGLTFISVSSDAGRTNPCSSATPIRLRIRGDHCQYHSLIRQTLDHSSHALEERDLLDLLRHPPPHIDGNERHLPPRHTERLNHLPGTGPTQPSHLTSLDALEAKAAGSLVNQPHERGERVRQGSIEIEEDEFVLHRSLHLSSCCLQQGLTL